MHTLLLIDANSLIHRAYHALPKTFTAPDGRPVNAIYGLARMLLRLWREERPDYAAACFDTPVRTFREEEYKEYKAQRPPTADDLIPQIVEAPRLFEAFGIKTFSADGFEADDCIATFARRLRTLPDTRIVILTGDRDTLQLVEGERLVVRAPKKGISDTIVYDEKKVKEEYGLLPSQMLDYKALVGDPSDNVKGVPGIGPKTAASLLGEYKSLDVILESKSKDPRIHKVQEHEKEARFSKRLVTLRFDAPVEVADIDELSSREENNALRSYFESLRFSSLLKDSETRKKNALPSGGGSLSDQVIQAEASGGKKPESQAMF